MGKQCRVKCDSVELKLTLSAKLLEKSLQVRHLTHGLHTQVTRFG